MAPLLEYNTKVMLQLTGSDYTSARPGLDLVAILEVRDSMQELKTAMRFVVRKLSPIDRLSIITFSGSFKKLCSLRQITEASQRELEELIDRLGDNRLYGHINIENALLAALDELAHRKVSAGRVVSIMLVSHSQQSRGRASKVIVGSVPVYTFGLGTGSNPNVLKAVAANSMGGTYSHVRDGDIRIGGLTMAFSQCLAGLLSVSVQDLELTVEAVRGESTIVKVAAGSYLQTQEENANGSVTVRFGNLYSREVRNVIVDLRLPAIYTERSAEILKVTYSYNSRSSSSGRLVPPGTLIVQRTGSVEVLEEDKPAELKMEEARLHTAKTIKDACRGSNWPRTYGKLVLAQNMLMLEERGNPLLRTELQELMTLTDPNKYSGDYEEVRHYALSSETSHDQQRFAARGGDIETMRLFTTPRMDKYLEQAKKFHEDPTMPLPSVDEEVKEEFGALTIDVAIREAEMRILSLEME